MDWTFGSSAIKKREEQFNAQHGDNVWFGVGTFGTDDDPLKVNINYLASYRSWNYKSKNLQVSRVWEPAIACQWGTPAVGMWVQEHPWKDTSLHSRSTPAMMWQIYNLTYRWRLVREEKWSETLTCQVGNGGTGAFNNCAGQGWSMFPGPFSEAVWGHQYGGCDYR